MLVQTRLFTSESVSDGHPHKICDHISDAVLNACLEQGPLNRVANRPISDRWGLDPNGLAIVQNVTLQSAEIKKPCEAYAIGIAEPVAVGFETFTTARSAASLEHYQALGIDVAALMRPGAIIKRLGLTRPLFRQTATFRLFGRNGFAWEASLPTYIWRPRWLAPVKAWA